MEILKCTIQSKKLLADTLTPVSIYYTLRDKFAKTILLESSDYHGNENSYSYICVHPLASFKVSDSVITEEFANDPANKYEITGNQNVPDLLAGFMKKIIITNTNEQKKINGLFGYCAYNSVQYFENITLKKHLDSETKIPEIYFSFYKYIIAINHFNNEMCITENLPEGEASNLDQIEVLIHSHNYSVHKFSSLDQEKEYLSDKDYLKIVRRGKEHCKRGDVFQIVLSRHFSKAFTGDEFNVYRSLRSINPSPYLFYFDYGNFKIFGSSPEAHITIKNNTACINPIAGTFKRTGNDQNDSILAEKLLFDPKENAEHVMLVDLARNDLSRNSTDVSVSTFREIQYYSHVIHLVSKVTGKLKSSENNMQIMADSFPAGTLTGAPKYRAMELIDTYENHPRGFYGGCIGYIGFDREVNVAIMIRSFLSKNNTLHYRAGAGIVSESKEENELQEINNKLVALRTAIEHAKNI